MTKTIKKRVLSILCIALAVIVAIPATYLLYVLLAYYRVEDNLTLDVKGEATAEVVPVGEALTLVTYNIGFGAYSADYSFFMDGGKYARAFSEEAVRANTAGAMATARGEEPDFVLFQEVDVNGTRSYHVDQTALLSEGFAGFASVFAQNYDSAYLFYPFHSPIGANRSGLMTFSRYDITGSTRRSLPIEESLYKFLDLDRAYTVSTLQTSDGKSLMLYNVHLSAYTSDGTIADEQLRMLAADMQAEYEKGNYVIAAGDFNKDLLGDSSKYFERCEGEEYTWAKPLDTSLLPEGFTCHTGSNLPTCRNADAPYRGDGTDFVLSVDGIIVSPNVKLLSCETVDAAFAYSDHNPVSVCFELIGG